MNEETFKQACRRVRDGNQQALGIGTLGEKTLHAVLKYGYEPQEENHETKIGGYVADIVGENGIIEIQTQGFDRLRKKLSAFLEVCDVTAVSYTHLDVYKSQLNNGIFDAVFQHPID